MDSVGVHPLGSAAAQGGQDTYNKYANGSPFTGWSSDVQALQDAPHHGNGSRVADTVTNLHMLDSSSLWPVQQCP